MINDYPRFSHRGVLIDSSRHFIFKETIFDALVSPIFFELKLFSAIGLLYEPCSDKTAFAYSKTKALISCAVTAQLISAFVFAT